MDEVPPIDGPAPGSAPAATDQGPPPETTPAHTPELSKKKGRILLWALVVVGVGVLGLGGCGLAALGLLMDSPLSHDLVDADFTENAEPFPVGENGAFMYSQDDGHYRITSTEVPDGPGTAVGDYARVAYNVTTRMNVLRVDGAGSAVTLGCFNEDEQGYEFQVDPEGASLGLIDGSDGKELNFSDAVVLPEPPFRMSMTCTSAPESGTVTVTGSIDGERVVRASDTDGNSDWAYASVGYWPDEAGQSLVVDDVVADVPGQ